MSTHARLVTFLIIAIVIIVAFVSAPVPKKATPQPAEKTLSRAYTNSAQGFSLRLPEGYTIDESYQYQELGPGKEISGVKFTIPPSLATSTNLGSDIYVSVEEVPQATGGCAGSLFLNSAEARTVTDGDTIYSVASSTGAAAGNRYEETIYALSGTNPCVAVRYFIHYGAIENYPPGALAVHEFNKQALLATFNSIRRSLVIVQ